MILTLMSLALTLPLLNFRLQKNPGFLNDIIYDIKNLLPNSLTLLQTCTSHNFPDPLF